MTYHVETENLTKQYGNTAVVQGVSLHVPEGKIYGLLGRNGAGKTTLMKMLLRLVRPTGGKVSLFGSECVRSDSGVFSRIGSMIEAPGFYGNLTAAENLRILEKLRGRKGAGGIEGALETVGLQDETDKPFAQYSLGMKQRLGIAASIMHCPELLILDEPTNGLDPIGISEIRALLCRLSRMQGITILISSHVLSEIEQIADVFGIMHAGSLIQEIDASELQLRKQKYVSLEVSDAAAASELLAGTYRAGRIERAGNVLRVYGPPHLGSEFNRVLIEHGLAVSRLEPGEDSLETYFADVIGGGGIA